MAYGGGGGGSGGSGGGATGGGGQALGGGTGSVATGGVVVDRYMGDRCVNMSGSTDGGSSYSDTMEYLTISAVGNAQDFGGEVTQAAWFGSAASDGVRGTMMGGGQNPTLSRYNNVAYFRFLSFTDARDFGDLSQARIGHNSACDGNRVVSAGGHTGAYASTKVDTMDYYDMSTFMNALDWGELTAVRSSIGTAVSDGTRGFWSGGATINPSTTTYTNTIDFVTIRQPSGAAREFGDLVRAQGASHNVTDGVRAVMACGWNSSTNYGDMDVYSLTTQNDATYFAELTQARRDSSSASNGIRGIWMGGFTTGVEDTIDYANIGIESNAKDFGVLSGNRNGGASCSGA